MAQVEWSIEALEDLDRLGDYEAGRSLANASLLVRRLTAAAEFPHLGRVVPEYNRPDVREVIHQGYRLIYLLSDDGVHVLHVLHGAVDLRRRLRRRPWELP